MSAQSDAAAPRLQVAVVPVTPFQQNCSIVMCRTTGKAAIVDPGGDVEQIAGALAELKVTPEKILLTHGHIDHAGGATELAERFSLPIEGPHLADKFLLDALVMQGAAYGMAARAVTPTRWLDDGETVSVGAVAFDVRLVPGHTPGHVVFINPEHRFSLVGDTLFQGSIGRTDFPYGDHAALLAGIKSKLFTLGDDMVCLPGHGPATRIGDERTSNPFVR